MTGFDQAAWEPARGLQPTGHRARSARRSGHGERAPACCQGEAAEGGQGPGPRELVPARPPECVLRARRLCSRCPPPLWFSLARTEADWAWEERLGGESALTNCQWTWTRGLQQESPWVPLDFAAGCGPATKPGGGCGRGNPFLCLIWGSKTRVLLDLHFAVYSDRTTKVVFTLTPVRWSWWKLRTLRTRSFCGDLFVWRSSGVAPKAECNAGKVKSLKKKIHVENCPTTLGTMLWNKILAL